MIALIKKEASPGLWLGEVETPKPGIDDVLIRIHRTAICGTDVHIYKWDDWAQKTIPVPMHVGHEFSGEIVEVGSNVKDYTIGEIVTGEGHVVYGNSRSIRTGKAHLAKETLGIGVNRPGAFAEYLVLPASNVWKSHGISKDILSIFDPFGNATHTALSWNLVGEDVLITGSGPIGIMAAAVCRHAGARSVVITDVNEYRLKLAKQMGATRTVNVLRENLDDVKEELYIREGFDIALEMSGVPSAFETILEHIIHGGKISMLGIMPENTGINWSKVIFKGLLIKGIYGREMFDTWYKMDAMVHSGLDLSPIITHRFHYTEFEKGFEKMIAGECGKVILNWEN
ncbi:MAG: L-threonine 3-dehydrogenase [Lentisphaerales bacterium]|nr:L-threonine 3-dehydrogenase [Lentisphaerales bacterium]